MKTQSAKADLVCVCDCASGMGQTRNVAEVAFGAGAVVDEINTEAWRRRQTIPKKGIAK